ncbi:MAG: cell division protein ZapA [Firmicutes bacterium]|nr:cell division protein ZapA [Bacillota bacterium]
MGSLDDYNRVTVEIWGQSLTLRTQNEAEYVERLAQYVDQRMASVAEKNPRLSTTQVALLAAINLTDELFRANKNDAGGESK